MRSANRDLTVLIGLNGLFYFAWAWGSYQTVYLQECGMSSSDIGILNAVSSVVAIFASTFWGMISDRINSIKKTIIINFICLTTTVAILPMLPAAARYASVMFIIHCAIITFSRSPSFTLMDNITVRNCNNMGLNYGAIRSVGSLTYTLGSILVSALMPFMGVRNTFVISACLMLPTIGCVLLTADPKVAVLKGKKAGPDKESFKKLFKSYYYVTFLIFTALYFIPRTSEYSFLSYFMEEQGIPLDNYGFIMAVRAGLEIPFLFFISKIRKKIHLRTLIVIASCFIACECLGLGLLTDSFAEVLLFSACFGTGNGIFIGVISVYLFRLAPEELKATAQSIYASVSAAASIVGNLVGGFAYELLGGKSFYLILGIGIIMSAALLCMTAFIGKQKNIPDPTAELG